ncbi:hypothetical protein ACW2QC_08075 [Virgibacillus sp. FSP13]
MLQQQIHLTEEWIKVYAKVIDAPTVTIAGRLMAPSTMIVIFWQLFSASPMYLFLSGKRCGIMCESQDEIIKTCRLAGIFRKNRG